MDGIDLSLFSIRKLAAPTFGDIDATAETHPIKTAHLIKQLDQTAASAGPANQPITKRN
jgi:hypothetical protein